MRESATIAAPNHIIEQRFSVPYSYPVIFTRGICDPANPVLRQLFERFPTQAGHAHRAVAVLDDGLAAAWPKLAESLQQLSAEGASHFELVAEPLLMPGGERSKNDPALIDDLHRQFQKQGLDRHSFVMCFGGGAVLDAVGYAAATAHRGVRLLRVPTTVLAQNDSGVGVKNGINAYDSKNFLGTFAPPAAVLNDFDFLGSLSTRDASAGMAEAVKVALIRDAKFFQWLETNAEKLASKDPSALEHLVRRTAELHLEHIATSGDPFEMGSARPLDFGHWAAHKLEQLTHHSLRHGEAVAIGIALDTRYAALLGMLTSSDAARVERLLQELGLPIYHPALEQAADDGQPQYLRGLEEFRQHLGGELSVTLLRAIGQGVQVSEIDPSQVKKAALWLKEHAA